MKRLAKLFVLGFIACSCVNEAYDLNKVDGTAVIMKDVAMPIGSVDPIKINDIMSLDGTSMIAKDPDGNLFFQFKSSESLGESITVPPFTIPFSNNTDNSHSLKFDVPEEFVGFDGTKLPSSHQIPLPHLSFKKGVLIDAELPSQVIDAEYVDLSVYMDYSFSVSAGAAHIKEGFKLVFPDWMTIEKAAADDTYIVDNNVVTFKKNVTISKTAPFVLKLVITRVVFPEGSLDSGKVTLYPDDEKNMIEVTGDIYMDTADFSSIPASLEVKMNLSFTNFSVKSTKVKLDMDLEFEGQSINLPEYPDFFTADGLVLDINDVFLYFNIKNTLPVGLELNADFQAYRGTQLVQNMHIGANSSEGTSQVLIPANTEDTQLVFSKLGTNGSIALPLIGNMLTSQPDRIMVSDVVISSARDYVVITPGTTYDCSLGYELYAPLAFGKNFRFNYDMDLSDMEMDLSEYGISNASLSLNVTNSIPLNFALAAKALDENGQQLEGLDIEVVGGISSGVHGSPSRSTVEIRMQSADKSLNFKSLALSLTASGPADKHLGTALNENQGLEMKGISLRLPDGVTVDVNSIFSADPSQEKANE